jgi:hypothetical protein
MWKKLKSFFKWAVESPPPEKKDTTKESWRKDTVWEKEEPKRARTKKGQYRGDDKSTPDVNEAWEGGKAPSKSGLKKKKKKKKRK